MSYFPTSFVNPADIPFVSDVGNRFDVVQDLENRVASLEYRLGRQQTQLEALQASMANISWWAVDLRMSHIVLLIR